MEWMIVVLIVAAVGGALGYFAGKKWKTSKNRKIEAMLLVIALGLAVYAVLDASKVYLVCVALLAGELIRITFPKK